MVIIKEDKNRVEEKGRSFRFGVCFDTSKYSVQCLKQVLGMMQEHDKVCTISVKDPAFNADAVAA